MLEADWGPAQFEVIRSQSRTLSIPSSLEELQFREAGRNFSLKEFFNERLKRAEIKKKRPLMGTSIREVYHLLCLRTLEVLISQPNTPKGGVGDPSEIKQVCRGRFLTQDEFLREKLAWTGPALEWLLPRVKLIIYWAVEHWNRYKVPKKLINPLLEELKTVGKKSS
jgi:hypothetical protein